MNREVFVIAFRVAITVLSAAVLIFMAAWRTERHYMDVLKRRTARRRVLDGKYHITGGLEVVKTSNGVPVPPGEPLFLFRGRDYLALPALLNYRALCVADNCTDYQIRALDLMISEFRLFAEQREDAMKQSGITRGL